jgi:ribosomal protein L31
MHRVNQKGQLVSYVVMILASIFRIDSSNDTEAAGVTKLYEGRVDVRQDSHGFLCGMQRALDRGCRATQR